MVVFAMIFVFTVVVDIGMEYAGPPWTDGLMVSIS